LTAIPSGPAGKTLVVGGDGRFFARETVQTIARLAAGNGVAKLIIGYDSILSTPAVSHVIRKYEGVEGGILLTASHNPGGPENDFGIKYNGANGGPAPENVTEKIYELTKTLAEYKSVPDLPEIDLKAIGKTTVGPLAVEVIDSTADYVALLKEIFDFEAIKTFLHKEGAPKVLFDALNGVSLPPPFPRSPIGHAVLGPSDLPSLSVRVPGR
jgi:phosphoglucomutase